ncbi:hypothetical protein KKC44_03230, partial [Patescibacteria group bacterium]|nr:hypothetical protein [Patescibacteria group bacterium]
GDDLVRKYPEDIVRKKIESLSLSDIFTMLQSLNINPEMTFADVRKCMEQQRESLENEERPPLEHVIALALISGVEKKMPSAEKLQVFFHGVFPTESWEEAGEGEAISDHNKKTIEGYIENMPFHRVLRLFAYNHMIEKENPTGVLLMQMEILRFIRDRETGDLGDGMLKTRAYQAADNFAESILDRSYFESLRKYLHVSDKMLAQTGKVFDDAGQMLLILAGRGIIAAGEPTLAFAKEHKVLTGAFGAYLLRKPVVLMANYRMSRYVPEMLAERVLGWNRGESSVRNNILAWLKIRHSPRVYNDAAGLLREVTGKIRNIRGVTSVPKPQVTALCDDMYDGFKRTIRDGATDVHYERFLARVRHERSLTTNADMIKALDKLDDEVTRLLAEGNVEARHAIRVTSHPFRGRIVSVGVPGLIEGLGIYWSLKSDIPLWWHYAQAEDEARGEEKDATADVLEWQKKKKEYVDIPMDLGSGIAFWLAQNRLKQMAVTRAGGIPFRGALGATRAGLGGATVAFLAIEALRMEAQYILDSVEKDVSLLELNDKDLEKMSKEELEETLLSRSSDRLSAGQKLRGLSLSRWIRGDTFEGMHWENEVLRENVMYGYLFDRLLRKGQMGDPFAMSLAVQIFDRDGSKKKDGAAAMRAYENDCQTYLHRRYGTRNDIKAISQQAGLERALHDADLYASFQADIRSCRRTFTRVEEISELTSNSLDAIASLEDRIALAGSDEVRNLTDQRDAKLAYIDDLNDEFILQMSILDGYEQIQLKQPDGSVVSLLDFATQPNENYEGSYADISEGDVIAQLTSYRAAKSAVMMESVEPKEDYQLFLKDAESLYEKLKVVNVPGGTWSINPEHYNLLLEYGFLLDMHPSFDSDLKVRQAIWDLPGIYWKQYPGEHPYAESFNNVRDLISENIAYVKALRHGEQYYPAKHENDPIHQTPFNVHYESSLGVSDPTIIVTLEGKEYVLEAKKKTEQSFDTSVGTFTYRPNASAGVHGEKGLWFFDGTQEGLFHVATRNNLGIEQPGEWMSVKERLRKNMIVKSGEWFPYLHDYFTLKAQVFEKGTIVEVQGTSLNHTKIKPYVELSWKGSKWEIRAIPGKHVRRLIFESMTSKEPETLVVEVNDQNEQMPLAA